ncbi:peptide chain release factor 2 [Patescibacteria group bacterium]|nr:peptide chain release factor 2 [Patescibacteria group bacterium]MBU1890420.1 peptide chain release factor 2 [Patescibacteria group bacterium]
MKEVIQKLKELQEKISETWRYFDLDRRQTELKDLEYQAAQPDFWQDQNKAKKINRHITEVSEEIDRWLGVQKKVKDLYELANEAEKETEAGDIKKEIIIQYEKLAEELTRLEFLLMLNDKYDHNDAIMAIHAGAGGVEAQDWAAMLLRMFLRYCERRGWTTRIVDKSMGEEAGIKSVTFEVEGRLAYGYLKAEAGVHRLVRLSPFDGDHQRHTSFALTEVLPQLEETDEIEINPKELRIDTFTASGHGGQSVNTTHSAVRVVHLPTKISVSCQNERSQSQNKATALKILKSKLHKLSQSEKQEEKQRLRGEHSSAEWGNQIRSYVLHPYQMVKDHRTKHETNQTEDVLDGDLDSFIEAWLKQTISKK